MRKTFEVVSKQLLKELVTLTNARIERYFADPPHDEWVVVGAPFFDPQTNLWNQSIRRVD